MTLEDCLDPLIPALLLAGIYAAMSAGMTIIYGGMKNVELAHAGFLMMGACLAYEVLERFHIGPIVGGGLALPVFFLFGIAVDWLLVRWLPKSDQPTLASLLLMFGFWLVLQNIAFLIWNNEDRSITTSYTLTSYHFGDIAISKVRLAVFIAAAISVIVLQIALKRSWFGKAIRALIQNPQAAKINGVDGLRTAMITFGLGSG